MVSKKHVRLTPELQRQILAAIRAGGYPHIAAQAFDVPPELFGDWLQRGAQSARAPWRGLARAVLAAHAQARLRAEIDVLARGPRYWLEHGPGRERPDKPGWSSAIAPAGAALGPPNALCDREFLAVLQRLRAEFDEEPQVQRRIAGIVSPSGRAAA